MEGKTPHVLDPKVQFRHGKVHGYTPRLVAFDAKGAIDPPGHASTSESTSELWSGEIKMHQQAPSDTMNGTTSWSKHLHTDLHPKSIFEVSEYRPFHEFHSFYEGSWSGIKMDKQNCDDAWENVRYFLEESDNIQGVQCLVDVDSGWGAYASDLLTEFQQECRSATVATFGMDFAYPFQQETNTFTQQRRKMNIALSMHALHDISGFYVPIHVSPDGKTIQEQSELVARALETVTGPIRMRNANYTMSDLKNGVIQMPQCRIAELSCVAPLLFDASKQTTDDFFQPHSLLPTHPAPEKRILTSEWITTRAEPQATSGLVQWLAKDAYKLWRVTDIPIPIPATRSSAHDEPVQSMSQLSTSSRIGSYINHVVADLKHVNGAVVQEYHRSGMETDQLSEVSCTLSTIADGFY